MNINLKGKNKTLLTAHKYLNYFIVTCKLRELFRMQIRKSSNVSKNNNSA